MKMCVIIEEFLYAKKIENQTQRTLRGYKNTLNLFASWLEQKWSIDELEDIRVSHLKQYVSYHLKVGHKGTYLFNSFMYGFLLFDGLTGIDARTGTQTQQT